VRGGSHLALKFGVRWITVPLLAASIWMILQALQGPRFMIDQMDINGATIMSPSRVRSIGRLHGKTTFQIDPSEIVTRLLSLPEIAHAEVKVGWPNSVVIDIVERKPVLEWNDAGTTWWVSEEGLAILRRSYIPDLVQVTSVENALEIGDVLDPVLSTDAIAAAVNLSVQLEEGQEIFFDNLRGFGFQDPRGWMAYFGWDGDMGLKYQVYIDIVAHLDQTGYPARLVSVENLSAAFYR
jgi:cell division septal protein FtsQ